jgi:hypothetical protein
MLESLPHLAKVAESAIHPGPRSLAGASRTVRLVARGNYCPYLVPGSRRASKPHAVIRPLEDRSAHAGDTHRLTRRREQSCALAAGLTQHSDVVEAGERRTRGCGHDATIGNGSVEMLGPHCA